MKDIDFKLLQERNDYAIKWAKRNNHKHIFVPELLSAEDYKKQADSLLEMMSDDIKLPFKDCTYIGGSYIIRLKDSTSDFGYGITFQIVEVLKHKKENITINGRIVIHNLGQGTRGLVFDEINEKISACRAGKVVYSLLDAIKFVKDGPEMAIAVEVDERLYKTSKNIR
jgi:hypothetical protein